MNIPEPWVLSCDRTEWQYGGTTFNILMLGVVHQGVAIPLVWTMLDKVGNFNTRERSELFSRFLRLFGDCQIDCLTADREFVGGEWFGYLLRQPQTPFRIRLKIKKHGRMAKSIFRFGLDFLRNTFFDLELNADAFSKALTFLSCT
jgi:hypothetical protein